MTFKFFYETSHILCVLKTDIIIRIYSASLILNKAHAVLQKTGLQENIQENTAFQSIKISLITNLQ